MQYAMITPNVCYFVLIDLLRCLLDQLLILRVLEHGTPRELNFPNESPWHMLLKYITRILAMQGNYIWYKLEIIDIFYVDVTILSFLSF